MLLLQVAGFRGHALALGTMSRVRIEHVATWCCALLLVVAVGAECPVGCSCADRGRLTCASAPEGGTHQLTAGALLGAPLPIRQLKWTDAGISSLAPNTLRSHLHLERLDLSRNNITELGNDTFRSLSSLTVLNLTSNKLNDLPRNFFKSMIGLEEIYVADNKLHAIPFQLFAPLANLKYLDLSHNQFVTFLNHFNKTNRMLSTLLLNDNRLEKIYPNALEDLKALTKLDLSNNRLTSITKGLFDSLDELRYLNLKSNPMLNIYDEAFKGLPQLSWLNIGDNYISKISQRTFKKNTLIETLYLEQTKIEVLTETTLKGLKNIKKLYLRNNELLKEIEPYVFTNLKTLETLDISGNELTYLPKTFAELDNLKELFIDENPWACDCRMAWFANWAEKRQQVLKSELSCGPHAYPNDMLPTLQHLNCTAPRIIYSTPVSRYVLLSNAILECKYAGNPQPSITWVTPVRQIFHWNPDPNIPDVFHKHPTAHSENMNEIDNNHSRVRVLENGTLFVQNVTREDCGIYICYASNPTANVTVEVILNIDPVTLYDIKINSLLFGTTCAAAFLGMTLMVQFLRYVVDK